MRCGNGRAVKSRFKGGKDGISPNVKWQGSEEDTKTGVGRLCACLYRSGGRTSLQSRPARGSPLGCHNTNRNVYCVPRTPFCHIPRLGYLSCPSTAHIGVFRQECLSVGNQAYANERPRSKAVVEKPGGSRACRHAYWSTRLRRNHFCHNSPLQDLDALHGSHYCRRRPHRG